MEEQFSEESADHAIEQLREFKAYIHALIEGGELVSMVGPKFKGVPVTVIAAYDGHSYAPFAIYLGDDVIDHLEDFEGGLCEACAEEHADEILAGVDFDAPIPFITLDNPDPDKKKETE